MDKKPHNITQGDVFDYLNTRGEPSYHTQTEIADAFNKAFYLQADKSSISNIKTGGKSGYRSLDLARIDKFYQELFSKKLDGASADLLEKMLESAKKFVEDKGILFKDHQGRSGDTFETYVKRMFTCGLPNISAAQEQEPEPLYPLCSDSLAFFLPDFFTGREDLMGEIGKRLDQDKFVVLNGMGGIGKSTLAMQFAEQNSNRYSSIQKVSGEFSKDFQTAVLELRFDGLKDESNSPEDRYKKRLDLMRQYDERTLIIIDNVDTPWDNMNDFYNTLVQMGFHLIITSRLTGVFKERYCLPVPSLSDGEQRELFSHYSHMAQDKLLASPAFNQFLRDVEGHTLLIELVAKTMYCESENLEEMLEWLHGKKNDYGFMEDGELKNPKEIIRSMLFRGTLDGEQLALLNRLAFLPVGGISRRLFLRSLCPGSSGTLSQLEYRSWVIRENDRIRVHPVIRDAVRDDMPHKWTDYSNFLHSIQEAMEQPSGGLGEEERTSLCLVVRGMWEALQNSRVPLDLWDCLTAIARHCKDACQYETALNLCQLLSDMDEDMAGGDKRIELNLEIGGLHQRAARYDMAIKYYQKALDMTQQYDDQRGSCYNSLGVVYRKNAEYEKAAWYLNAALKCFKRVDLVATAQNDLGVVYMNQGAEAQVPEKAREFYQKAKSSYENSLELRERMDASPRDIAFSHHNIGSALYRLGRYSEALEEHKKALKLREDNHLQKPDIAASLNWIGNDLLQLGRLEEAKKSLEESLNIRKTILGERHPDLAWALMSLSEYHEKKWDLSLAVECAEKAYRIRKEHLRQEHPYTIMAEQRLNELKKRADESGTAT